VRWFVIASCLAGCWTGDGARPRSPREEPAPAAPREPFPRHSEWRGTYRCSQGISAMRLVLDATPAGEATAVFEFGPTDDAPDVEPGAYRLKGVIRPGVEGTFELALVPDAWIEAPAGYTMTPLRARSSRKQRRLVGRIQHPSCGALDVRRTD